MDCLVLNPRQTRGSGDRGSSGGSSGVLRRTFPGTPLCLPRRSRSQRRSLAETRFSPSRATLVYSVSDEWVSVEMTYANKLSVTQRLDGAGELAAPRLDAATFRRVVFHHGGSIWTEGEVDRNVVFYFVPRSGLPSDLVAPPKEVGAK